MSKYLKYTVKNIEPVRIANDETSQHGQTDTLRYLPGTSIRGLVINELAERDDFEQYKKILFSGDISFLNGYPSIGKKETVPSLKGFYEDKKDTEGKKKLNNVIAQDVEPGYKRASLGHFCYLEGDCICCSDVKVGEDLNINTGAGDKGSGQGERTVFRSQYIKKNHTFTGYILFRDTVDDKLIEHISEVFDKTIRLGNRKSIGYGTCICTDKCMEDGAPYPTFRTGKTGCGLYMVLLSNTVMRDQNGELVGLNMEELANKLGCNELSIVRCATSTVEVRGYNRMWNGAIPSMTMYEAGSVFYLKASEPVSQDRLRALEESGIGIRRDEGFGQIAFVENFAAISYKLAVEADTPDRIFETVKYGDKEEIENDIRIAARGLLKSRIERCMERYLIEHPIKISETSSSKFGVLASMCMEYQYVPVTAKEKILAFAEHDRDKSERQKKHDGRAKQDAFYGYIRMVLEDKSLWALLDLKFPDNRIMGIGINELCTEEDALKYKLQLMIRQIRYENREGKNGL